MVLVSMVMAWSMSYAISSPSYEYKVTFHIYGQNLYNKYLSMTMLLTFYYRLYFNLVMITDKLILDLSADVHMLH